MGVVNLPNLGPDPITVNAAVLNGKVDPLATEFNGGIDNDNIASGAGIVYSKLTLTDGILNADINSSAAIADSKLAQITTASKVHGSSLTGLASIPAGAGVIPTANLPSGVSINYRSGLTVSYASATTLTVDVGNIDVNGAIAKSTVTTLTLSTNGDWASGSSERATSTYGYVGIDASGNIKMDTTAPTHSNYGVSVTAGLKRYVTWHSTVYRVIGYFYMNATGSGELAANAVSNIKESDVSNILQAIGTSDITISSQTFADMTDMALYVYATGKHPCNFHFSAPIQRNGSADWKVTLDIDGTDKVENYTLISNAGDALPITLLYSEVLAEGTHTIKVQWRAVAAASTVEQNGSTDGDRVLIFREG